MRAAIAAGLLLRVASLIAYLSSHGWKGETWEYEEIALSLWHGGGFVYLHHGVALRSAYMPVFPVLCAALHALGGASLWLFYAFHLACAAALTAAVHSLARDVWGDRVAKLAAWLVALEPALVVYQSYKVDAVPLASLLLVLSLIALRRHARTGDSSAAAASGAFAAVAVLTRPDMVVFWAAPAIWAAGRRLDGRAVRGVAVAALAFAALLSPWVARNYRLHGRFMPATTLSGVNLWIGNNPNSTGTPWAAGGTTQWQAAPEEFRTAIKTGPELAANDRYRREALRYINAHPAAAGLRWAKAFAYFWWFTPDYSGRYYYRWVPGPAWLAYRLSFLGVLCLLALGTMAAARERAEPAAWIWGCALALAVLHCTHFVEGRHRLIVMPLLLILAARGWEAARGRSTAAPGRADPP